MKVIRAERLGYKGAQTFRLYLDITRYDLDRLEDLVTSDHNWFADARPKEYDKLRKWALRFWLKLTKPCDKIYYGDKK